MKFYILVLNDIIKTFSIVGKGIDCSYTFLFKDKLDSFKNIDSGDMVIGYVDSPRDSFCYVLRVQKKVNDKECIFQKELETTKGIALAAVPENIRSLISSNKGKELFVETTESVYNWLVRAMIRESTEKLLSFSSENSKSIKYETGYSSDFDRNRIFFGAPGTGKSFSLNDEKDKLLGNDSIDYERVTFHPDYSYGGFIGTYKPVPCIDSEGRDAITYKYVPGPFMRVLVKALKNSRSDELRPFLLLIEEINRADVAAVFGDIFQLLDRADSNASQYPIQTSEDIRHFLSENLGGTEEDYENIKIPDNMFIWATMNSADQGVLPMDTAFKRRWNFTYIGIDESENKIAGKNVILGKGTNARVVEWNSLRKAINDTLISYKVNEDKLLGAYFVEKSILPEDNNIKAESFIKVFKNKVIMYLFDDAAKQKRPSLFSGCTQPGLYSSICKEFDEKGIFVFCDEISKRFIDKPQTGAIKENSSAGEEENNKELEDNSEIDKNGTDIAAPMSENS